MKKIASVLVSALLVSALVVSGCGTQTKSPSETTGNGAGADVIKIGVFEPMTGANAAGGALEVEGVKLANKLYPEVLGIVDRQSGSIVSRLMAGRIGYRPWKERSSNK